LILKNVADKKYLGLIANCIADIYAAEGKNELAQNIQKPLRME